MATKIDMAKIFKTMDLHDQMVKTAILAKIAVQINQAIQTTATAGQITIAMAMATAIEMGLTTIQMAKVVHSQIIAIDVIMSNRFEVFRETQRTRGTAGRRTTINTRTPHL